MPIAIGNNGNNGNKVEELDNKIWKTQANFSFADPMFYYSMLTFHGELYVFGKLTIISPFIRQYI